MSLHVHVHSEAVHVHGNAGDTQSGRNGIVNVYGYVNVYGEDREDVFKLTEDVMQKCVLT